MSQVQQLLESAAGSWKSLQGDAARLAGKELEFNTDGSYQRAISAAGKIKTKVLIGIPKLI